MVKRMAALLLALLIMAGSCLADPAWKENTPAQSVLKTYITNVNGFLAENGEKPVNSIFEQFDSFAELGITGEDNAEMPEDVTVTVYLYERTINYLLLRVNDANRFPRIAGAFLRALNPRTFTQEETLKVPAERAGEAVKKPKDSFQDEVEEEKLNGTSPRVFYAYFPDQYHDGVNWMQMMIIFPMEGCWNEETGIVDADTSTSAPDRDADQDQGYEGYFPDDGYNHYEVFSTPTPEPDSPAGEYDPY